MDLSTFLRKSSFRYSDDDNREVREANQIVKANRSTTCERAQIILFVCFANGNALEASQSL